MINNVSYVSGSSSNEGMQLSLGDYNTESKVFRFWVFQTRFERDEKDNMTLVVRVPDNSEYKEYMSSCTEIKFEDLDWDHIWSISKAKFKAKKVVDGTKRFKLSELKEIR